MPDTQHFNSEAAEGLFAKLDEVTAGMLGVEGARSHMQPMAHFADASARTLWFITSRQTDLAREVGQGGTAHYCLVDGKDGYYACLSGSIRHSDNSAKVDELWSPTVAAWFTGRDDPDVLLLEMSLRDAEIWTATDSSFQFGFEIAKANLQSEKRPDLGTHQQLSF